MPPRKAWESRLRWGGGALAPSRALWGMGTDRMGGRGAGLGGRGAGLGRRRRATGGEGRRGWALAFRGGAGGLAGGLWSAGE